MTRMYKPGGLWKRYTQADGLADNYVLSVAVEANGTAWFGTAGEISRLGTNGKWKAFRRHHVLTDNTILSIALDADGCVWFGTNGGGASHRAIDGRWRAFTSVDGLADDTVRAICVARDGSVWFGTGEPGKSQLCCLSSNEEWRTYPLRPSAVASNILINDLVVATDGTVWLATSRGIHALCTDGSWGNYEAPGAMANSNVSALALSRDGTVWVGRLDGALRLRIEDSDAELTSIAHLAGEPILDVAAGPDDSVWFSSYGKVSHRLDDDISEDFTEADGLRGHLLRIAPAKKGVVWFGSDNGVCCYQPWIS